MTTFSHTCRLSGIEYNGKCSITECWHNAPHATGACVLSLERPLEMDDLSVLRMLENPEGEIDSARETLEFMLELWNFYQNWSGKAGCKMCGKYWPGGVFCTNTQRCCDRQSVISSFREHRIWSAIEAHKYPKTVFWDFVNESEERQYGMARILGTSVTEISGEENDSSN